MKDILIITSYFPPEIGAASHRIFQLAEGLQKHDFKVEIITPLPNYPTGKVFEGYKGKFKQTSIENNLTVHRLWIYASNSKNKILRLMAMVSYSLSLVWFFLWSKIPKIVIIQSPPLLVAFTAMFFLRSKKRKLILNVSDLWPIAGLELGVFKRNFSYKLLEHIERFNYRRADLIMGQSEEILAHVTSIFPLKDTFLYRNYPDFAPSTTSSYSPPEGKIKMVYAGLLGVAQGIYRLIQKLDYSTIEFHIYGTGAEKEQIEEFISKHPELPIVYHGEVDRKSLLKKLSNYDVAIIPLLNRIYGSVPSKIFEYARLGLPMIYFGGGEGENIVEQNKLGWVAKAGNYENLNEVISKLKKTSFNLESRQCIKAAAIR
ncbi:MAG TPA: glycosyltransferase family 4 protein, partial [Flavobacteriaceae bacterium]